MPSIFEQAVEDRDVASSTVSTIPVDDSVKELEKKMLRLSMDRDVENQKQSAKIKSLLESHKQDKDTIAQLKKKLAQFEKLEETIVQQKRHIEKLEETIANLKHKNLLSANDGEVNDEININPINNVRLVIFNFTDCFCQIQTFPSVVDASATVPSADQFVNHSNWLRQPTTIELWA